MAIIFDLYVECATSDELEEMKSHFSGLTLELQTGKTTEWEFASDSDIMAGDELHAFCLWSSDLSRWGVSSLSDAIECTEAGIRLYKHLYEGPAFQFARVAWESSLIGMPELDDYLSNSGEKRLSIECVLSETIYKRLGKPKYFKAFRPGYVWTGYRGEVYRPLESSDQKPLTDLNREFFPQTDYL